MESIFITQLSITRALKNETLSLVKSKKAEIFACKSIDTLFFHSY